MVVMMSSSDRFNEWNDRGFDVLVASVAISSFGWMFTGDLGSRDNVSGKDGILVERCIWYLCTCAIGYMDSSNIFWCLATYSRGH